MTREEFLLVDDREVVLTPHLHTSCDGGPLGHPIEFLTLERGGATRCKYCDRRFVHTNSPMAEEMRRRGIVQPAPPLSPPRPAPRL